MTIDPDEAAGPMLDAERAKALARWRQRNGERDLDERTLREAAERSTIEMLDGAPSFDDEAFGGLAEFIAEIPF